MFDAAGLDRRDFVGLAEYESLALRHGLTRKFGKSGKGIHSYMSIVEIGDGKYCVREWGWR